MAQRPESIEPGARAPGYARAPSHRVAFVPSARRVQIHAPAQAVADSRDVADSKDVVVIEEGKYPERYYLARADVAMEALEKVADKTTYCPFKGLASYFRLRIGEQVIEDGAWSYEQPYQEAELLRDRICFDRDKVTETIEALAP